MDLPVYGIIAFALVQKVLFVGALLWWFSDGDLLSLGESSATQ